LGLGGLNSCGRKIGGGGDGVWRKARGRQARGKSLDVCG
jgi:hypothetical protein